MNLVLLFLFFDFCFTTSTLSSVDSLKNNYIIIKLQNTYKLELLNISFIYDNECNEFITHVRGCIQLYNNDIDII